MLTVSHEILSQIHAPKLVLCEIDFNYYRSSHACALTLQATSSDVIPI